MVFGPLSKNTVLYCVGLKRPEVKASVRYKECFIG